MPPTWLLAALLGAAAGCQDIQLYFGRLPSSMEIESVTLLPSATSCSCCGLCHRNPACQSLTFRADDNQCILYSSVGGLADFDRKAPWTNEKFFFMPGRSQSGEFCQTDSDCITSGDFCRGRICTTDDTLTCRDFYDINNNLRSDRYWGYIAGREILLGCSMGSRRGLTQLMRTWPSEQWTAASRLNMTTYNNDGTARTNNLQSILWAADIIRDASSSSDSTYQVLVSGYRVDKQGSDDREDWIHHHRNIMFAVPRDVSLLGDTPRSIPYNVEGGHSFAFADGSSVSFPYLVNSGGQILYHANMNPSSNFGVIVRTTGPLRWVGPTDYPNHITVYIRE
ncbi:hypothetical protein FJT64_012070 [Amphibalanus amphitrite]|uniref:Apple domain-containing protein n=1 Tax=Amphibalanus amphitrite TaxID=1232801 RepID=A0A6A4V7N2_AMPAM|nr:hypothetical protein FJT64_012070 [Amphibalanus amphitrite]